MQPYKIMIAAGFCTAIISACSNAPKEPSSDRIRRAQLTSFLGPTEKWSLPRSWQEFMPGMRDRAYRFCMLKKQGDEECLAWQDRSIFLAAGTDSFADAAMHGQIDKDDLRANAIQQNPRQYLHARAYCFATYADAGSADARVLGPCIASATGADFFGIVRVPTTTR